MFLSHWMLGNKHQTKSSLGYVIVLYVLDSIYSSGKVGPCIWLYPLFFYLWHLLTLSSCTEKLGRMSVKFLSVCWYPTSLSFNIFFGFWKEGMIIFNLFNLILCWLWSGEERRLMCLLKFAGDMKVINLCSIWSQFGGLWSTSNASTFILFCQFVKLKQWNRIWEYFSQFLDNIWWFNRWFSQPTQKIDQPYILRILLMHV